MNSINVQRTIGSGKPDTDKTRKVRKPMRRTASVSIKSSWLDVGETIKNRKKPV